MQSRKRGKAGPAYSSESLMFRSVTGLLLVALGVFTLISIVGGLNGVVFTLVKQVAQGLAGQLCFGIPIFLVWGGALVALSSRSRVPVRPFWFLLGFYFCALSIVILVSGIGETELTDYVAAYNRAQTPPVANPEGFPAMVTGAYRICGSNSFSGGALGMLMAWPLRTYVGRIGGIVLLSLIALACLLFFSRFDLVGLLRGLRERTDDALERREQQKRQRVEQKRQEVAQAEEEKQRRLWQQPAYQRRQEAQAVGQAPYAPPQTAFQSAASNNAAPVELYDEMIVPELPTQSPPPNPWKPEGLLNRMRGRRDAQPVEAAPEPRDRDSRRVASRMEEIRKRKEALQQEMDEEVSAVAPSLPPRPIEPDVPAPSVPPSKESAQPERSAYQRPIVPPKVTAQQQIPMSGVRLDAPTLKLPEKKPVEAETRERAARPPYAYPTLELLNLKQQKRVDTRDVDAQNAVRLEQTLESFSIPARVQRVTHGPAVTRFELGLTSSGVNVKRITSIADNIALEMAANGGVRIEIPIPGTNLFGIEVPNKEITGVTLAEVLTSPEMTSAKSPLSVALGRDIAGKPIICDLAKMPHLLIAGQTGSGKSVCINSIINSLLYRSTPDQVRMIMIDPKVVELQCYNVVPHLLIPVVSDPHKASGALAWAVQEMLDRYHKMQCKGVRELAAYNAKLVEGEEPLPRIVIIIDELADLMLACKKEVEESIIRLAQLARASGIHMVVATQRPTVDVITGLIKSNIPSRIAFAVSSNTDSRTILDTVGAEKLLGKGDMFYFPTGASAPLRVQGCFLSDAEIENVVGYIGEHSQTDFNETIFEVMESASEEDIAPTEDTGDEGVDDRLQEAIEMVLGDGQASISMLQRRMKIGYARAGRLIDDMAARGIVSKSAGSKPREILMSYDEYLRVKDSLFNA